MDVEVPFLYEKKEREIHTSNIEYVDRDKSLHVIFSSELGKLDSDLAIGLLLLVITSLWAPLLELFLQLRSATMRIRGLTIATASLTHESTCSSLYVTKRSMKLYQMLNTEKKKKLKYIMHE